MKPRKNILFDTVNALDMFVDDERLYFKLKSGKILSVKALHFSFTHNPLIRFSLKSSTTQVLENKYYPQEWGELKELVIKPAEDESNQKLKWFRCNAWLQCDTSFSNETNASELVVTFSTNLLENLSILDLLTIELADLDWENNAENSKD